MPSKTLYSEKYLFKDIKLNCCNSPILRKDIITSFILVDIRRIQCPTSFADFCCEGISDRPIDRNWRLNIPRIFISGNVSLDLCPNILVEAKMSIRNLLRSGSNTPEYFLLYLLREQFLRSSETLLRTSE